MGLLRRFAPRNDKLVLHFFFVIARHAESMSWQSHSLIPRNKYTVKNTVAALDETAASLRSSQ